MGHIRDKTTPVSSDLSPCVWPDSLRERSVSSPVEVCGVKLPCHESLHWLPTAQRLMLRPLRSPQWCWPDPTGHITKHKSATFDLRTCLLRTLDTLCVLTQTWWGGLSCPVQGYTVSHVTQRNQIPLKSGPQAANTSLHVNWDELIWQTVVTIWFVWMWPVWNKFWSINCQDYAALLLPVVIYLAEEASVLINKDRSGVNKYRCGAVSSSQSRNPQSFLDSVPHHQRSFEIVCQRELEDAR